MLSGSRIPTWAVIPMFAVVDGHSFGLPRDLSDSNCFSILRRAKRVISRSSVCLVAIDGSMGTLSEMALSLKWGKPVFTLYEVLRLPGARTAGGVEELIEWVFECLAEGWETGNAST